MGQLVNDAKELVMRLKEREKNVDQVVIQSNALAKKVDAIQQLENELINLNEKANHRSKVAVLSSIQKENKVIKLLQQENEDLKESLEEHQSVLEIIMSKYRQQMLQLIRLKKQQELSEQYYKSKIFQSLQEKTDQIAEMTEVMKTAIELDERLVNENEEKLQSLLVENRGLKEMLKIRTKYGGGGINAMNSCEPTSGTVEQRSVNNVNLIDQEIQTEDLLEMPASVPPSQTTPPLTTAILVPFQLDETSTTTIATTVQPTNNSNYSSSINDEVSTKEDEQTSLNAEAAAAAVESMVVRIEEAAQNN